MALGCALAYTLILLVVCNLLNGNLGIYFSPLRGISAAEPDPAIEDSE